MIIDDNLLDELSLIASENIRLRKNYNLHESETDEVQRLLNAMEPGTVLPVHRHLNTAETYMLLRGEMKVFYYDDNKQITDTFLLNPQKGKYGMHIPEGQWHSIEVIDKGTVIFEVKKGPYSALSENDILKLD